MLRLVPAGGIAGVCLLVVQQKQMSMRVNIPVARRGNVVVLLLRLEVQLRVIFSIVECWWYFTRASDWMTLLPESSGFPCGNQCVLFVAQKYKDVRASGDTAFSSPCWDRSHHAPSGSNNSALIDFSHWCISAYPAVACDQLLVTDLCCSDFIVAAVCGNSSGAGELLSVLGFDLEVPLGPSCCCLFVVQVSQVIPLAVALTKLEVPQEYSPAEFPEVKKEIGDKEKAVAESKRAAIMESRAAAAQAKLLESMRLKGKAVVVPEAKRKKTTIGRAALAVKAFAIVPTVRRTMIEDAAPLRKIIKASAKSILVYTSAPKTIDVQKPKEKTAKSGQHSNDESMSIVQILLSLPEYRLLSYVMAEEPVPKIRWSQTVEIRGVDERHRSLLQIAPEVKGKQILTEYGLIRNPATEIVDLMF
ncbi:hypothetical protein F511_25641 [Dorcoceras hygrometricum]|uniref:Uncharacterized protein n=1 Tax=Dorcoceras hygrometricum TaxID=472368 RepID=A0A2Z7BR37_9LAMI|nr:hypothetical protein F511_25641 [Dorcoceras hygrometricum]